MMGFEVNCEKMHCRMSAAACIKRQQALAVQNERRYGYSRGNRITTDECLDCVQGKEIMERIKNQAEYKTQTPDDNIKTKICKGAVCRLINPEGVEKSIDEFSTTSMTKDGRSNRCRKCNAWGVRKTWLTKKKGIKDPRPQDYIEELGAKKPGPAPSTVIPAKAGIQEKTVSVKERLKNHFVKMMAAGSSLSEAYRVINGSRQDTYGNPEDSFGLIAEFWHAYLSNRMQYERGTVRLSALDVAHMMALFKIARMLGQAPCRDNYIDAQGYLAIAADRLLFPSPSKGERRGEGAEE